MRVSSQLVPSCRRRRCQCWLIDHDGSHCPHWAVAVVVVVDAGVVSVAIAVVAVAALAAVAAVAAVAASPEDRDST